MGRAEFQSNGYLVETYVRGHQLGLSGGHLKDAYVQQQGPGLHLMGLLKVLGSGFHWRAMAV